MPTAEQILDAMYNTGHDHDPVAAVMVLIKAEKKTAWVEGYTAGHTFGYEYAQDTYDGPSEDPTVNPYED